MSILDHHPHFLVCIIPLVLVIMSAEAYAADKCHMDGCQALSALREELANALRKDATKSSEDDEVEPWVRRAPSAAPTAPASGRAENGEDEDMEPFSAVIRSSKQVGKLGEMFNALERRVRSLEQQTWSIGLKTPDLPMAASRVVSFVGDEWTRCTEGPCRCRPETRTLSCWRQGLEELPPAQAVPIDTKVIDLGANHLTTLHRGSFKGLLHLTELDLFDNRIDYLPPTIFESLESIIHIRLHHNNLEELSEKLFLRQHNLETLELSTNSILRIEPKVFDPLKRCLIFLSIARNRISKLPEEALSGFEKLEELDMSGNILSSLPVLRGLPSLRRLRLHRNKLRVLPPDFLRDVIELEVLTLRGNRLTDIPQGLFSGLSKLRHLDLASNWITSIEASDFADLVSLRELHLSQNFLESLPGSAFSRPSSYSSLERLFLFSNNLEVLESSALEGLYNLSTLMLNNNLLRSIGGAIFEHTPNLRKLQLDSNKFHFLPTRLFHPLTKLMSVKLAKNPWHCDCSILYLATWLRDNKRKVWDSPATCRGPGDLGGQRVEEMSFDDLCEGQWASLVSLQPRVPVSPNKGLKHSNRTESDGKN